MTLGFKIFAYIYLQGFPHFHQKKKKKKGTLRLLLLASVCWFKNKGIPNTKHVRILRLSPPLFGHNTNKAKPINQSNASRCSTSRLSQRRGQPLTYSYLLTSSPSNSLSELNAGTMFQVEGRKVSEIGPGLLVLVGIHESDSDSDAEYMYSSILSSL